jgi:hypothetical protein
MRTFCIFLCLFCLCSFSLPAFTQGIEKKGRIEFSPLGGIFFKNDFTLKNEQKVDQSGSYFTGGRLAIYLNSRYAVEGTFLYSFGDSTIVEGEENTIVAQKAGTHSMSYGGNLLYHLGEIDLVPFITFGAGIISYNVPDDSSFPAPGKHVDFNTGGGVKYYMWEYMAFRADFRIHFILLGDEDKDLPSYFRSFEFSGGISVSF